MSVYKKDSKYELFRYSKKIEETTISKGDKKESVQEIIFTLIQKYLTEEINSYYQDKLLELKSKFKIQDQKKELEIPEVDKKPNERLSAINWEDWEKDPYIKIQKMARDIVDGKEITDKDEIEVKEKHSKLLEEYIEIEKYRAKGIKMLKDGGLEKHPEIFNKEVAEIDSALQGKIMTTTWKYMVESITGQTVGKENQQVDIEAKKAEIEKNREDELNHKKYGIEPLRSELEYLQYVEDIITETSKVITEIQNGVSFDLRHHSPGHYKLVAKDKEGNIIPTGGVSGEIRTDLWLKKDGMFDNEGKETVDKGRLSKYIKDQLISEVKSKLSRYMEDAEGSKKRIASINAKYDAELAELEKRHKN